MANSRKESRLRERAEYARCLTHTCQLNLAFACLLYLSVSQSLSLCFPICLSDCLTTCLSASLSLCISSCLSACLSVYFSACLCSGRPQGRCTHLSLLRLLFTSLSLSPSLSMHPFCASIYTVAHVSSANEFVLWRGRGRSSNAS